MLEITPFELMDLLDAGFEPIEIDYLCFLRWVVHHDELNKSHAEPTAARELSPSTGREGADAWEQARTWVGDYGS